MSAGAWPRNMDATADGMMGYYEERDCLCDEEEVAPGDIVFFCKEEGRAVHVEFVVDVDEDGRIYCIGASGGGSTTTDEETAWRQNAYIKVRPEHTTHPALIRVYVDPYFTGITSPSKNGNGV